MSVRIPQLDKKWSVAQEGDFFGNVQDTRNVNFDDRGRISLSKKPTVISSSAFDVTGNADIRDILSIAPDNAAHLVVTNNRVFTFNENTAVLTRETNTSTPVIFNGSDGVIFNSLKFVSGTTTIGNIVLGGSWTERITGLTSNVPHPMANFENKLQLAVGNGNEVRTYNTSYSLQVTMTLPSEYVVTSIRWRGNKIYIGTRNRAGQYAKIFTWNGSGTEAQAGHTVNATWVYSLTDFLSSMTALTSSGQLLWFNGGGFEKLSNFPIYYTDKSWLSNDSYLGKCLNRGMVADGDLLYINIDGTAELNGVQPEGDNVMPSGVWCFDPKVGLYHRNSPATNKYQTIAGSSLSSNVVTMASNHEAETGDAVYMSNIGSLTGITVDYTYFVIKDSDTGIKLALTAADANAGNAITLGGSTGAASFLFDDREAIGATYDNTYPGAIMTLQTEDTLRGFYGSQYLFGARVLDTDGSTDIYTLQSPAIGRNVSSFTTTLVPSEGITDTQQKLFIKFEGVNQATDKIVVKYRLKKRFGLPTPSRQTSSGLATWSSNKVVAVDDTDKHVRQAQVGDEIEVISGGGSGRTAHIVSIREASATVREFTLDEPIEGVISAQKSEIQIDNWTKLGTITNSNTDGFQEFPIGTVGKQIEFKIEMRGVGVKVEELALANITNKKVV